MEPTIDDPMVHLEFIPEIHGYKSRSPTGERTRSRMFGQRETAAHLAKLSDHVRTLVASGEEAGLVSLKALIGQHFYIDAYAQFWRSVGIALAPREG